MGTPAFSVPSLQRLVDGEAFDVVAVVTQPDRPAGRGRAPTKSPVKRIALDNDITVLQPRRLRKNAEMIQILCNLEPDVIAVAAYGLILPADVLEIPAAGCINVHASLLPKYRGAAPVAAAILNGEDVTGVTIMLMDEEMDHGPILAQRITPIRPVDTRATLSERLAEVGADLLVETLPQWVAGEIQPQTQDHTAATYAYMLKKEDGEINWSQPAARIARMIRAYQPWPGAYTYFDARVLKLLQAQAIDVAAADAPPGTVVETDLGLAVVAGEGAVLLERVQLAGKRTMDIETFVRGQRNFVGSVLGT